MPLAKHQGGLIVRVVPMQADDLPAVAALSGELGYDVTLAAARDRFANLATDAPHGLFVAHDAGVVVGWIHIHSAVAIQDPPWAEIRGLVVTERNRGSGIGSALVAAAEAWAEQRGYDLVRVRSRETRHEAHRFYQSNGYRILKTSLTFEKHLTD
jgi:GNAT superfamily N-acetyltransferase